MPLYNKKPYVLRSIESVQKQTYLNWELIIIDDGSTDGSAGEVPPDPRIRLCRQDNRGPSAARNRGIQMASGEFVTFIDADDIYFAQKLSVEMDILWKEGRAGWMVSAYEFETRDGVNKFLVKDARGNDIGKEVFTCESPFRELTVAGWPSDGICMKKEIAERLGGFREDLRYGEITEFVVRSALAEPKVAIYQQPLYRVIEVPKSASKGIFNRIESMRQTGEIMQRLSLEYPEVSDFLMARSRQLLYSYTATLSLFGRGREARKYLTKSFPAQSEKRWWKMWLGSWIPAWMLRRFVNMAQELRGT